MKCWPALLIALLAAPAGAVTVSGEATVIDGDTLEVAGRKVRLIGIDAPEADQNCDRAGQSWACGGAASDKLRELIGTNRVSCSGGALDQYRRLLAVCTAGSVDLNRTMVALGWAMAFRQYSEAYVAEENEARASGKGLWASGFVPPEEHRRAEAEAATRALRADSPALSGEAVTSCAIKGNRSARGEWIYHLPGMRHYDRTRAEETFCTEAQATAAGYRKSKAR